MGSHVLPFYVVCDESYSMVDHLRTVNAALRSFHRVARDDPFTARLIRFSLIGFSERVRLIAPLAELGPSVPVVDPAGEAETSFGAAFSAVRATLEGDLRALTESGFHVLRPCVLFVSDGQPTDPAVWPRDHAKVVDREWADRPDILVLAAGDADLAALARIGTVCAGRIGEASGRDLHDFLRERAVAALLPVPGGPPVDRSWIGLAP